MFAPGAQTPRPPGTGGKRVPCGHLREAQSDPKVGSETSGGCVQRPLRRLSDREKPGDTNAFGGAARPLRTSRRLLRAHGPAAFAVKCLKPRFLRHKGRSKRLQEMLRHKALGHRREAPALWAGAAKGGKATRRCAGGKRQPSGLLRVAQSDPQA